MVFQCVTAYPFYNTFHSNPFLNKTTKLKLFGSPSWSWSMFSYLRMIIHELYYFWFIQCPNCFWNQGCKTNNTFCVFKIMTALIEFPSEGMLSHKWVSRLFLLNPWSIQNRQIYRQTYLIHTCNNTSWGVVELHTSLTLTDASTVHHHGMMEVLSENTISLQLAYLLLSASSVESGSSILLVSGSRKQRAPLTRVRLLKTMVGMDQWYTANMLSNGDSRPPALLAIEPKPEAVCLKQKHIELSHAQLVKVFPRGHEVPEILFFMCLFHQFDCNKWLTLKQRCQEKTEADPCIDHICHFPKLIDQVYYLKV